MKDWATLGAVVAVIDWHRYRNGDPTLSASFLKAIEHPKGRWPTLLGWGYLTAHLCGLLPKRWDVLRRWG